MIRKDKTMKKHIYLGMMMLLVGVFSLLIGFALDQSYPLVEDALVFFWIAKGVGLALLAFITLYLVVKKGDVGNMIILAVATALFQFLPLSLRFVLQGTDPSLIWAVVISFVFVIGYFGLFLALDISNDKFKQVQDQSNRKDIKSEEDSL